MEPKREASGLSYVPADTSSPLLASTVGGILRDAAVAAPETLALVEGAPGERRRWPYAELLRDAAPLPLGADGLRVRHSLLGWSNQEHRRRRRP